MKEDQNYRLDQNQNYQQVIEIGTVNNDDNTPLVAGCFCGFCFGIFGILCMFLFNEFQYKKYCTGCVVGGVIAVIFVFILALVLGLN